MRYLVLAIILLTGCAGPSGPMWDMVPVPTTPYDQKQDEWSARYRLSIIERCIKAGHAVVSVLPVRCKGPAGEYIP